MSPPLPMSFVPYLPELGTNLVTALSRLNVNDFSHLDELFVEAKCSNARVKATSLSRRPTATQRSSNDEEIFDDMRRGVGHPSVGGGTVLYVIFRVFQSADFIDGKHINVNDRLYSNYDIKTR